jgi:hypothetical protein
MTRTLDRASGPPFNIPTSFELALKFTYADGRSYTDSFKDFGGVAYVLDQPRSDVIVEGNIITSTEAPSSQPLNIIITVRLNLTYFDTTDISNMDIKKSSIEIIKFTGLSEIDSKPFPLPSGWDSTSMKTNLSMIGCPNPGEDYNYQVIKLSVYAIFSNGYQMDVAEFLNFSVVEKLHAVIVEQRYVRGLYLQNPAGFSSATVNCHLDGVVCPQIDIKVFHDPVEINGVIYETTSPVGWDYGFAGINEDRKPNTQLWGSKGTEYSIKCMVVFEDGTEFADARENFLGPGLDHKLPSTFVSATSHIPSVLSINEELIMTGVGNSYSSVPITLFTNCSANRKKEFTFDRFVTNFSPKVGDVDIGNIFGISLPPKSKAETFSVAVRVNGGFNYIIALTVEIRFDDAYLSPEACTQPATWDLTSWNCTLKDPINLVKVSTIGSSSVQTGVQTVAIVEMKVVTDEQVITRIRASILVHVTRQPGANSTTPDHSFGAFLPDSGDTYIELNRSPSEGLVKRPPPSSSLR